MLSILFSLSSSFIRSTALFPLLLVISGLILLYFSNNPTNSGDPYLTARCKQVSPLGLVLKLVSTLLISKHFTV